MDPVWTQAETAQRLSVHERSLERWRAEGTGPEYVRLGARRVGYRESAILAWLNARTFQHRAAELAQAAA